MCAAYILQILPNFYLIFDRHNAQKKRQISMKLLNGERFLSDCDLANIALLPLIRKSCSRNG